MAKKSQNFLRRAAAPNTVVYFVKIRKILGFVEDHFASSQAENGKFLKKCLQKWFLTKIDHFTKNFRLTHPWPSLLRSQPLSLSSDKNNFHRIKINFIRGHNEGKQLFFSTKKFLGLKRAENCVWKLWGKKILNLLNYVLILKLKKN